MFKKPHCFCTWTSSLFSVNQQSDNQQCESNIGLNHTSTSSPAPPPGHEYYQVYHTPVLGEMLKVLPCVSHLHETGSCLKPSSSHVKPCADWFNGGRWDNAIITRPCLHFNPVPFCHVCNFYGSHAAVIVPASFSSLPLKGPVKISLD